MCTAFYYDPKLIIISKHGDFFLQVTSMEIPMLARALIKCVLRIEVQFARPCREQPINQDSVKLYTYLSEAGTAEVSGRSGLGSQDLLVWGNPLGNQLSFLFSKVM